ncbi:hypothetical protein RUM43_009545 [Polyplax serrata]|uniref:Uncharacterized protein n=1 Tax=Polyplax serrata TaxID=468196 RepID=A0AAN8PIK8_POLSC
MKRWRPVDDNDDEADGDEEAEKEVRDMTPFPHYELIFQIDHDDGDDDDSDGDTGSACGGGCGSGSGGQPGRIQVGGLHYILCSIIEKLKEEETDIPVKAMKHLALSFESPLTYFRFGKRQVGQTLKLSSEEREAHTSDRPNEMLNVGTCRFTADRLYQQQLLQAIFSLTRKDFSGNDQRYLEGLDARTNS